VLVLAANPGRVVADRDLRALKASGNRREDPAFVAMMAELRQALETGA
jgi:NitT/TauT family transport system ATP-binding protein